jgi:hypothetical protein
MRHAPPRRGLLLAALATVGLPLLVAQRATQGRSLGPRPEQLLPHAAGAIADDLVLYRLRDRVLARTPGGRRATDLFYEHIGDMVATVGANPAVGGLGVSWLESWEGPLTALVEGRGAQATLTQAQVDSLVAYVEAMKSGASPALLDALAREQSRLDIPGWAGMTMDQWLRRVNRLSCVTTETALCLDGGRFRVDASWRTPAGRAGQAQAVPLTGDTGYLWFFGAANVEAVVKVLNGCGVNQRFWVFAGGLTNVEVDLTVADTWTGQVRTYRNPLETPFQPLQDTGAFRTCAAAAPAGAPPAPASAASSPPPVRASQVAPSHACVAGAEALCLQGGRYRVETEWRTPGGASGNGKAVPLTADTGYFWFFTPGNVEEVVKVHDGCPLNQRRWVFAAGLTNVRVVTRVTDTHTGAVRTYTNPQGQAFLPLQDTGAFASCG